MHIHRNFKQTPLTVLQLEMEQMPHLHYGRGPQDAISHPVLCISTLKIKVR